MNFLSSPERAWYASNPSGRQVAVVDIASDGQGGLWFATAEGLMQASGVRWTMLDCRNDSGTGHVSGVAVAGDGALWAITPNTASTASSWRKGASTAASR